jgi:DNA invertase Pin-like site-specific DNA recombinase
MYNQFDLIDSNLISAMSKVYSLLRLSPGANVTTPVSDSQRTYASAWAEHNNMPLDDELILAENGSAFAAFMQATAAGNVAPDSVLVVDGMDEYARREPVTAQAELWRIIQAGITVVTAANGKIYSLEAVHADPTDLIHSVMYMIKATEANRQTTQKAGARETTPTKTLRANMGKVYSYMRFSAMSQKDGTSIVRQSNYAEVYAKEHGMELDDTLTMVDRGLSAYHQRHVKSGALGVFLENVKNGKIAPGSILIVEGLDRLSRAEPLEAQAQLALIINAGVTVVTAADKKTYSRESLKANPTDLIFSLIVMIRAHEESEWKSKRAKGAIETFCKNWMAGTRKGRLVVGGDPEWVKWNGSAFELVEPNASRVRRIIELYLQGYGSSRIRQILTKEYGEGTYVRDGLRSRNYCIINSLLRERPHLFIGTRLIETSGTQYFLEGYYPPLLDQHKYNELIASYRRPKRTGREASKPSIFTGCNGLFRCGYCDAAMCADTVGKNRTDQRGVVRYDPLRRTRCDRPKCRTGSAMIQPLEKAVIEFCSNQMNLNSLVGRNMSDEIRSRLAASRAALPEQEKRLQRIMDAMFSTDDPPASFAQQARVIEKEIARLNHAIKTDEAALLAEANTPTQEAASIWATLAKGVEDDDIDARIAVRKLVVDTFEKIVFYRHGINPPPVEQIKHQKDKEWELLLVSKSGVSRFLRISRDGRLLGLFDLPREAVA